MGKISNTMNHYFADNRRFADLFNGACFQGKIVVRAEELSDASEVYHEPVAEKVQTGKRSKRTERIRDVCKNYPLHLYCVNEAEDLKLFHTEVGVLFQALKYRKDRTGLKRLMQDNPLYQRLDVDTLEVMSVMLEMPEIWNHREKYVDKNKEEQEEYNMCQAIREWAEEERSIGREEGYRQCEQERIFPIVKNMIQRGMSDEDIIAIAECGQEVIDRVRNGR